MGVFVGVGVGVFVGVGVGIPPLLCQVVLAFVPIPVPLTQNPVSW